MSDFDDELGGIDFGADFDEFAAGLLEVTVNQIDPDDATSVTASGCVKATKLPRKRLNEGVLSKDQCTFIFRADQLGFIAKAKDLIRDADGIAWYIETADTEGFGVICRADCIVKR